MLRPFVVLGRSREGVDFDALDGKPTHFFFVLGLKYERFHLPWLAKLVHLLAQPDVTARLTSAAGAEALYGVLLEAERRLEPSMAG